MTISKDIQTKIEEEFKQWEAVQYAGLDKAERQKRAAFFTPPALSIRMAEKFDDVKDKDILDPAAGAGGLLVVMIMCGADPNRIYGIELDPEIAKVCRTRLAKLVVPRHHIHVGNALDNESYEFPESPKTFDLKLNKNNKILEAHLLVSSKDGSALSNKNICLSDADGKLNQNNAKALHTVISRLVEKEIAGTSQANKAINVLNKIFARISLSEI